MGPYLYHLYSSMMLSKGTIASIFLTGFVSSMVFGTFAGSIADVVYASGLAAAGAGDRPSQARQWPQEGVSCLYAVLHCG